MRFAFYTLEASTLAWQRRLADEGHDVLVYHPKFENRGIGKGIIPLATSLDQWTAFGMGDPETIWFFDCTDAGALADRLRSAGRFVVGGGTFMDRLEKDRPFGSAIAEKNGVEIPPTRSFGTVGASIAYMKATKKQAVGNGGWAWKPNRDLGASTTFVGDTEEVVEFCERVIRRNHGDAVSCIVQERVKGVALSTARWWNGRQWVGPFEGTIEEKKFLNDDLGPATGCSLNALWFYLTDAPRIAGALRWEGFAQEFRRLNAPPGLYDINAVVDKDHAYFLEWTPRLGVDSELTSQRGITDLAGFLNALARGLDVSSFFDVTQGYVSVRLTVPPYPSEAKELAKAKGAVGVPIEGIDGLWQRHFVAVGVAKGPLGYEVADPFGFVGIALASGRNLRQAYDAVYAFTKKLRIPGLQYRTDAAEIVSKDLEALHKAGWETTPFLEVG